MAAWGLLAARWTSHRFQSAWSTALPGIEAARTCDLLFVFVRRNTLPEDQLKIVQEYCEAGRPVVGIRTASHAFQNWLEFDKTVLGGNYRGHYGTGAKA